MSTDSTSFRDKTPKSAELYQRATRLFPSGVTHDTRYVTPHPIFVERAAGSHKWDVDGNEYVDYFGGHGALILGHSHPSVAEAVAEQISKGTHYGASHELELAWAEQVVEMIPCAEKVRFTASGTEATMLGFRLARAFKERSKILRFAGHFHGWHDQVAFSGSDLPGGIPAGMASCQVVCPANDIEAVGDALADDDIAAVVLEPTGATFGKIPTTREFLVQLRALTEQRGVLLIFDEVISGFRASRGGAGEHYGLMPDMAFLAKIVAGGYPGGAVVGRADIMDGMSMRPDDPDWNSRRRVAHFGTYNANPVSAVAGLTTLKLVANTDVNERANRVGAAIREGMKDVVSSLGLNWIVYGQFSEFHVLMNRANSDVTVDDLYSGKEAPAFYQKAAPPPAMLHQLRTGMMANGVDLISWPGGLASAVHSDDDVESTIAAFKQTATDLAPVAAA